VTTAERLDAYILLYLDEQYGHLRPDPREATSAPARSSLETMDRLQMLVGFVPPPMTPSQRAVPYVSQARPIRPDGIIGVTSVGEALRTVRQTPEDLRIRQVKANGKNPRGIEGTAVDPFTRDPTAHPAYDRIPRRYQLLYEGLNKLRAWCYEFKLKALKNGRLASRNLLLPSKTAVILVVAGLVLGVMYSADLRGKGSDKESNPPISKKTPPRAWVDSMKRAIDLAKLKGSRTAVLHMPVRLPVPDSLQELTSAFGKRSNPLGEGNDYHGGVDLGAPSGAPAFAPGKGVVSAVGETETSGKYVIMRHDPLPYQSSFAHLKKAFVSEGDTVGLKDVVGAVGQTGRATGPHLHFKIETKGSPADPARLYEKYKALRDTFRKQKKETVRAFRRAERSILKKGTAKPWERNGLKAIRSEVIKKARLPSVRQEKRKAARMMAKRKKASEDR
jgi:murein DD-endopeptidase MepM/ murein hydrolase activator NlpD